MVTIGCERRRDKDDTTDSVHRSPTPNAARDLHPVLVAPSLLSVKSSRAALLIMLTTSLEK
ncbi:hypothetical protein E2562_014758 [Oryza meyeriana var. granulata]|uniref:Uncharacterized protein n=1 Tax=Oryza meyeriana var. granulata TaxID=110450 RepID=A0A6G1BL71_9ORYZ|nr:hypothetical protein E2562_014758 [Oryza meyeriana var. granulata]